MSSVSWFEKALLLVSSNSLLSRLVISTLEFSVLALIVAGLIRVFHLRPRRIAALVILVVLSRPVLGLLIGTPVPLVKLSDLAMIGPQQKLQTMEMTIVKEAPGVPGCGNQPELTAGSPSLDQPGGNWMPNGSAVRSIMISPMENGARVALAIWALGALLTGLWFAGDRMKLVRLVRRSTCPTDYVSGRYGAVAEELGILAPPRLYATDELESPALAGFLRTVVLVPSWMTRPGNESMLDWSLRHELIHRRHRDSIAGLVVAVSKALFFFNPLVWWLAGKWREETELACDEEVVRWTGNHVAYAENLYATLAYVHASRRVAIGASLFATRTQIGKRIETLLRHDVARKRMSRIGLALVVIIAVASAVIGAEPGARAIFFHDIHREVEEGRPDGVDVSTQLPDGGVYRLAVRGEYILLPDGSDFSDLTPGGRVEISEDGPAGMRKYTVTADSTGRLERMYAVDGLVRVIDDDGREWLKSRLAQMDRLAVDQGGER